MSKSKRLFAGLPLILSAVLKNLALRIGGVSYSSALFNAGTLTLQRVSVSCIAGFCIYNEGNLRLKNSTVADGHGPVSYGLLNTNTGTVVVKDTVFSDNYGIAFWNEGMATIDTSSFLSNSYDTGLGSMAAIYNEGTLTVTGTQFSNNRSGSSSAIGNSGTLVLRSSTFSDNGSSYVGGAISNTGQATIDSCRFFGNFVSAGYGGGAVFNLGTLTVRSTDFSDNHAASGHGGAVYNGSTGTLTIKLSTLSANTAAYGGAIANGGLSSVFTNHSPNGGTLKIGNSIITNNAAEQHGGGIYKFGTGTVQIDGSTRVTGNTPDDIFP